LSQICRRTYINVVGYKLMLMPRPTSVRDPRLIYQLEM